MLGPTIGDILERDKVLLSADPTNRQASSLLRATHSEVSRKAATPASTFAAVLGDVDILVVEGVHDWQATFQCLLLNLT